MWNHYSGVLRRNYTKTELHEDGSNCIPRSVGVEIIIWFNMHSIVGRELFVDTLSD
jgi:hypothetical protein